MSNDNIKKEAIKRWNEHYKSTKLQRQIMEQQIPTITENVPFEIKPVLNITNITQPEKKCSAYNNFVRIEIQKQKEHNKEKGIVEIHQQVLTSVSRRWKTLSQEDKDKYK